MKKIIVAGSSIAGAAAAEYLKLREPESRVTFVPGPGQWPIRPDLWPRALAEDYASGDLAWRSARDFKSLGIEVINDKEITRLNLKRRRAHFSDRSRLDFDAIILAKPPRYRWPDIRGNNKKGLFNLQAEADLRELKKNIDFADALTVQARTWWGFQVALALACRKKHVYVAIPQSTVFWGIRTDDFAGQWRRRCGEGHLNILEDQSVTEILGDAEARAVRFTGGKVVASDYVVFESAPPDTRVFSDDDTAAQKSAAPQGPFRRDRDAVFLADAAGTGTLTNDSYLPEASRREGENAARVILGEPPENQPREAFQAGGALGGNDFFLVGPQPGPRARAVELRAGTGDDLIQLFCEDNIIRSALLINGRQWRETVVRAVSGEEIFDAARWEGVLSAQPPAEAREAVPLAGAPAPFAPFKGD
jgi:hypothetical protein